jgi:hypothetical protein
MVKQRDQTTPTSALPMRRSYSSRELDDHSVVDRVTGRDANISSFKGLRRLGNLTISHSVPCATVGYALRAE